MSFSLSGLVFLFLSLVFPFLSLQSHGIVQTVTLPSAIFMIWQSGYGLLSLILTVFTLLLPAIICLSMLYGLLPYRLGGSAFPGTSGLMHCVMRMQQWSMAEVFIIGVLVSLIKLSSLADIQMGSSFWCYIGLSSCVIGIVLSLDKRQLQNIGVATVLPESPKKYSLQKCCSYLFTACLLYVPANLLPITKTFMFGQEDTVTILGSVILLWSHGSWLVAGVIFMASIVIPIAKILALGYLCLLVKMELLERPADLTKLYRWVEIVGRWSMIDVFVVAILVSVVQFGGVASLTAEPGILAFFGVVVLTMLAADHFDVRSLWQFAPSVTGQSDE
nr:paraquat-inducible protein A [Endozoicomonas arenosclerae]